MLEYERWYDKDVDIAQLLHFLENIDETKRKIISGEILQIVFKELNVDNNEKVKELSTLTPVQNKRWYDKDVDVQSAIVLIKGLESGQKKELLTRIIETLQQLIIKGRFE